MTTFFVTRHAGALDWARGQNITFDRHVTHLVPDEIGQGDSVLGSLPVHLAAEVCRRGARYFNLSLDLPEKLRGQELGAEALRQCQGRLEEFTVRRAAP